MFPFLLVDRHVVSLQTQCCCDHSNKQIAVSFCSCSAVQIHTSPLTPMMEMDCFVDVMMGFIVSVQFFRHISFSFINCPHRFQSWEANQVFSSCTSQKKKKSRNQVQFKVAFPFFMTGIQMECSGYDLIVILNTE